MSFFASRYSRSHFRERLEINFRWHNIFLSFPSIQWPMNDAMKRFVHNRIHFKYTTQVPSRLQRDVVQ